MVYELPKEHCRLKQAFQVWFIRIQSYFIKEEFETKSSELTLFVKRKIDKIFTVNIYVMIFYLGDDEELLGEFKYFMKEFGMTNLV